MTGFFAALSDLFNTWVLTALSDGIFAALSDLLTGGGGEGRQSPVPIFGLPISRSSSREVRIRVPTFCWSLF